MVKGGREGSGFQVPDSIFVGEMFVDVLETNVVYAIYLPVDLDN